MKTQIGLGVLAIPSVFDTLGLAPGVIALVIIGCITTWSDYMVGAFKRNHKQVYGIDDCGQLMAGRIGREILATTFCLCKDASAIRRTSLTSYTVFIFVSGSGMLGISIGLNSVSEHGACTAIFVAVAAILGFCLASIQTLGKISILTWIGLICILIASKPSLVSLPAVTDCPLQFLQLPSLWVWKTAPPQHLKKATGHLTGKSSAIPAFLRRSRLFPLSCSHLRVLRHFSLSPLR